MEKVKRTYTMTKESIYLIKALQVELSTQFSVSYSQSDVVNYAITKLAEREEEIRQLKKKIEYMKDAYEEEISNIFNKK